MTIAALIFADTFPIIITDSMISSQQRGQRPVLTPLVNGEIREGIDKHFPVGVARKIWGVGNESLFLYSGRVDHANELRKYLELLVSYTSFTTNAFNELIRRVETDRLQVSFIVISKEGDEIRYDPYNAKSTHDFENTYGRIILIGSGAESFYATLAKIKPITLPNPNISLKEYFNSALLNGLCAAGEMTIDYLDAEKSKFANHSCGAYFEVNYPSGTFFQEFRKILGDGTGHLFITIENNKPTLHRVVLSKSDADGNTILSANGELAHIDCNEKISISRHHFKKHLVKDFWEKSSVDSTLKEVVEPSAISQLTLYAEAFHPKCGHRFHTFNCVAGVNGELINVRDTGSDLEITFHDCNPLGKLFDRVAAQQKCDICGRS